MWGVVILLLLVVIDVFCFEVVGFMVLRTGVVLWEVCLLRRVLWVF